MERAIKNQDGANTQLWQKALAFHFPEVCFTTHPIFPMPGLGDSEPIEYSTQAQMSYADIANANTWEPIFSTLKFV